MTTKITKKPNNLDFAELDYHGVRKSIVEHLRSISKFEDFDFEAPAISLLVDALAYTQTYMAVHANMAVAETFLQSARLRANIVARAKELGYVAYSKRASEAHFKVRYTGDTLYDLEPKLRRGMSFNSQSRTFVLIEDYFLKRAGETPEGTDIFEADIIAREGRMTTHELIYSLVAPEQPDKHWTIPDKDIDLESLRVTTGSGSNIGIWKNCNQEVSIDPDTLAYYIQEDGDGYYNIYFGDGVLGKQPKAGEKVTLEYLRTSGSEGNGQIVLGHNKESGMIANVGEEYEFGILSETVIRSHSGNDRENTESIRRNAPRLWQAQKRAVTRNDYMALVMNEFNFIDAVNVWGGEDNIPRQYGVVFIAVKPKSGSTISVPIKKKIEDTIRDKYSVLTIQPRVVDAEYVGIVIDSLISYEPHNTNKTKGQLVEMIRDSMEDYFEVELKDFDSTVRYSRLVSVIDDADISIIGNVSRVHLSKELAPIVGRHHEYRLNYFNEIVPDTIYSTPFNINNVQIEFRDNGKGSIDLYENGLIKRGRVGKVDYENGLITISKYIFGEGSPRVVEFMAKPISKNDIKSVRNGIVLYNRGRHTIQLTPKQEKFI